MLWGILIGVGATLVALFILAGGLVAWAVLSIRESLQFEGTFPSQHRSTTRGGEDAAMPIIPEHVVHQNGGEASNTDSFNLHGEASSHGRI